MTKEETKKKIKGMVEQSKAIGYMEAVCDMTKVQSTETNRLYLSAFEGIIGIEAEFWVGDTCKEDFKANRPSQPTDTALFGDNYYFSLLDMRVVVNNFKFWLERYGTITNLRKEIFDWHDYAVAQADKNETHINLFNWLNGCPRDAEMSKKNLAAHGEDADEKKGGD